MRNLFIALAMFCCVGSAAQAQEFPPVSVLVEDDSESARTCQVSNVSSGAAVESELRYNRVPVGTQAQARSSKALWAYLGTILVPISGGCAVAYTFSLRTHQWVTLNVTGELMGATVEICNKLGVMTGPTYSLQSRLNAAFRDFTSQCISEYRKK